MKEEVKKPGGGRQTRPTRVWPDHVVVVSAQIMVAYSGSLMPLCLIMSAGVRIRE